MTLNDAWIAAELAICEDTTTPGWYSAFNAHARTGYPAALKALQEARGAMLRLEAIAKAHQGLCGKEVCHGDAIVDAIRSEYAALAKLDAPEEAPGEARK